MDKRLLFVLVVLVGIGWLTFGCAVTPSPSPSPAVTSTVTFDLTATQKAASQTILNARQTQDAIDLATTASQQTKTSQAPIPTLTPRPTHTPAPTATLGWRQEDVHVPLALSPQQLSQLEIAGVVASPREYPEFHHLYNETVDANLPVFVTSDALLHVVHLTFDQMLSLLEEHVFLPYLQRLNVMLLRQTETQNQQLAGTTWEEAARRVYAYVAVGSTLASPDIPVPAAVKDLAEAELTLIRSAGGPAQSPIFPLLKYGEDYSQYVPRSHYNKNERLTAYFTSMMWYGRMTFRVDDPEDPEVGPAETRMALLLCLAMRDASDENMLAMMLWDILYNPTAYLVGRSDDLTVEQYLDLMDRIYGDSADITRIADDVMLERFLKSANQLAGPRIMGLISDDYKPLEAVKGLRLMGQRFVPDAYIFQELIHPEVPQRYLPSSLDVMAVMGSERADAWLAQDPTTQTPQYADQSASLVYWLADLTPARWTETAYNTWLYALRPLLLPPQAGSPLFMQSTAWQDKQLNTALGSWAELKHDTLLYAKQPASGLGGAGYLKAPLPARAQNYLEPVPEVYARIAALINRIRQNLDKRGLLQMVPKDDEYLPSLSDRLLSLENVALEFQIMAEEEIQGVPLSKDEQEKLRSFGRYMEEVVIWANGDKPELDPAAIIADVATDPNTGEVLEVGIGSVHEIYVIAPLLEADGAQLPVVARGGIFSFYEFPSRQRLTDQDWRTMLARDQAPEQPAFTGGFSVPEAASLDIQAVIYRFQRDWADWVFLTSGYVGEELDLQSIPHFQVPVSSAVSQQMNTLVAALLAQRQYEGRRWIKCDYLSVEQDTDNPNRLLVTVRETWDDYLVTYPGDDPFAWLKQGESEPITARRGPYTIDVVYGIEPYRNNCDPGMYNCYQWRVVSYNELTQRPEWLQN